MNTQLENTLHRFAPSFNVLRIDKNQLIRYLGYDSQTAPQYVQQVITEFLPVIPEIIHPQCEVSIVPKDNFSFNKNSIECGKVHLNTQRIITKQLMSATTVTFFVCTIGNQIEEWSKSKLNNGDMVAGFIIDQIGSVLVELLANWMELQLDTILAHSGWKRTNRYSPGYCGWSVSEQKKLFTFFPSHPCGVTLTESALMVPMKSISGIIGIGPKAERKEYECSLCDLEYCYQRRHMT